MKRFIRSIALALCTVLLIVLVTGNTRQVANTFLDGAVYLSTLWSKDSYSPDEDTSEILEGKTGRGVLTGTQLTIYDNLYIGINRQESTIKMPAGATEEDIGKVWEFLFRDCPEFFWLDSYSYLRTFSSVKAVMPYYEYNETQVRAMQLELDDVTNQVLSQISPQWTDYEKERFIHDYIVKNTSYDLSLQKENIFDIYGSLVRGEAVCQGYALGMVYLLDKCEIKSYYVRGNAGGEDHGWVAVNLNGDYYYVDPTWDDPVLEWDRGDFVDYTYFNITTEEILRTHFISEESGYPIPQCVKTEMNFFVQEKTYVKNDDTVEDLARALYSNVKNGSLYLHAKADNPATYKTVFFSSRYVGELIAMANELLIADGEKPLSYSYQYIPNEDAKTICFLFDY